MAAHTRHISIRYFLLCCLSGLIWTTAAQQLQLGVFRVDVSPPLGSPVAYAPARTILDPLTARGVVLSDGTQPIVLCAVDYLGIANEGMIAWKQALAKAANTTIDRVTVHTLHQHDGMRCDFTTEKILSEYNLGGTRYDVPTLKKSIKKTARAVRKAGRNTTAVTHIGFGKAKVEKVASNRRILGADGKVEIIRWSRTTDSAAIAAPEGLIDPWLKSVSFWNDDEPIAVLTYYTTHPQSYYGQGDVTSEFIGLARQAREDTLGVPHIHFNGASGNIVAGKYNDGSKANRPILARRVADGMRKAFEKTRKEPASMNLVWKTTEVSLPLGEHLIEKELRAMLAYKGLSRIKKLTAAKHLSWLLNSRAGALIEVASLRIGSICLLHLPGELFVEYQLEAQAMRPEWEICTVAYGEYGPGYIGTKVAYDQGGYETSERASRVSPQVESVLMRAIKEVLQP
ncbi:MAG: hypothetical protein HKN87_10920 [Saprospiraceae bacterium]|nr:hypothetical protein [Saprospiraceae bacterium]